jgi:hypothetical protein
MRYHLIARRAGPLAREWAMSIQRREPVPGCDPRAELEMANKEGLPQLRRMGHRARRHLRPSLERLMLASPGQARLH